MSSASHESLKTVPHAGRIFFSSLHFPPFIFRPCPVSRQPSLPFDGFPPSANDAQRRSLPVPDGHFDESGAGNGRLRGPWAQFYAQLEEGTEDGEGFGALDRHAAAMARQVRENGVTYNVYAESGHARQWPLDLFPFLISGEDWAVIERGVTQRARLANAIVGDVYGAQSVLTEGLLPPGLVFGHPGYLRPLKGYRPPDGHFLHLLAVDLVHAEDGGWTVMSHRTETPSGMGYALENRLIVSSLFADAFRDMHVKRLPPCFMQLMATLSGAAGPLKADPGNPTQPGRHVVLLTSGPYNETYFEHTFLARHLGINLVEGKDLTVRNEVVYLKTLAGLERVDVVLRRLDDVFCDPVELRPESALGVPGLLQAMRAGNVVVSNVPGTGFLESAAIHGFLPGLSRALLDEPLLLPGVPTWWCGEAAARDDALSRLDKAFVMPTYPRAASERTMGMEQGLQPLDAWHERIAAQPARYTLQAEVPMSYAPRWEGPRIGARAAMVRVFAIADGQGGWQVMPGGFTRLAGAGRSAVSMQFGSSSVDTWVLSDQAVPALPPMLAPARAGRQALAVSSRAAENLFWVGRYAERAENNVRLARLVLGSIENSDEADDNALDVIGELTRDSGLVPPDAPLPQASLRIFERNLVAALAGNAGWTSVGQNLASSVQAAIEIRNRLSSDHWRTILAAQHDFSDAMTAARKGIGVDHASYDRARVLAALDHLGMQLAAISGAQGDRMTRDEAWRLLFIGRHIERVVTLSSFLRTFVEHKAALTRTGLELLLHLFDSTLTYRSLYPGRADMLAIVDQLVIEPSNPRGLYGVVGRLREKLAQLPPATLPTGRPRAPLQDVLPPVSLLPGWQVLCEPDAEGGYPHLIAVCDRLIELVMDLSDEISVRYFSHANGAGEHAAVMQ